VSIHTSTEGPLSDDGPDPGDRAKPLLEVDDLVAGYGPVRVLHGVSFSVKPREVVVILGANGAGKTTTLRALSGMLRNVRATRAELLGSSLLGRRPEAIARLGVAHVPQGRGTFRELSVEDNLRLGAYARRDEHVRADIDEWYTIFPRLGERRHQQAGSMSGGEQQMLAIARALMSRPVLLLLDEPSMGLAPLITQELFGRLGELNRSLGIGMLIVEQNANLALQIAQRGYVLETGRIITEGSAAELEGNDEVRRAYLGM
jgi:branched-chain amino acid transport system ATP-binding protein